MSLTFLRVLKSKFNINTLKNTYGLQSSYSDSAAKESNSENRIKNKLMSTFPEAKCVEVKDVSGGCGAMYEIFVEAPQFKGLTIVKQHRLITEALKEEIKDMHGLRIQTSPASD